MAPLNTETETELIHAGQQITAWADERRRLVRKALNEGAPLHVIGNAAGLSHQAIANIRDGVGNAGTLYPKRRTPTTTAPVGDDG